MFLGEGWLIIKQSDFNKELDDYLASRRVINNPDRKSRNFSLFRRKKKVLNKEIPEKVVEEMEEIEEEIKELDEDFEDDYDVEKREGLLARFFRLLRGIPGTPGIPEKPEEDLGTPELDEEVKEVLKISFYWLNKLPPQKMKEFKNSGDFELCKDLLIKYGLAREK